MLSMRSVVIAAFLAGVLAGCSAPDSAVVVSVNGTVFQRTSGSAAVPFTVANRSGSSQFVAHCGTRIMAALDRWNGDTWIQYSADVCPANLSTAALELTARAVASDTRVVADPGRFRLRIGITGNPGFAYSWTVVSGEFEIQ